MPDASPHIASPLDGFSLRHLIGQDFAMPSFDPFSVTQPTEPLRPPHHVHTPIRLSQLPAESGSDRLLRDMTALLDSLLR